MKQFRIVVVLALLYSSSLFSTLGFPKVYFSPADNLRKKIITLIDQEQSSIHAAVYFLTDGEVAQALIRAKRRGIAVELVVDSGSLESEWTKVPLLQEYEI